MNRVMDVSSILSKRIRNDFPSGTTIKPDMTLQEQHAEAML